MEYLRSWLIKICTAVFFITAIEMILPNNSFKKYSKFVLGLILITVFINPIVGLFNKNFDINSYSLKLSQQFEKNQNSNDMEKYKEENLNSTIEEFKLNLQNNCKQKLDEKYPDGKYSVKANARYDKESGNIYITGIYVTVKDGSVDTVQKVTINTEGENYDNSDELSGKQGQEIRSYLGSQLDISENIIHVKKG
ncbi:stage III sporulation protein AF [Clostridium tyrobutyricum]|uniref:stage III sporulation protein AF n=1 Tax=Clostridium tyrobutyricum TaxID=1519 RepID=UPI0007C5E7C9|nr:stage III sporulation protein AF [Clostridium tyrobutyricum]AND85209.1 stage III sporulation protein AF [Clostridium tyrobutyricum]MBR9646919.1 stage III sporulation protein AF [Clostridium tyrobutyricum]MBV4415212.1 stage III sporulation protein AF [Clostridium tyrobutyricum]MBV4420883.1 stage III sporulation protein AF [Clostridium tyrobutyricum]MBV4423992.1 stage III sporulation protein AF [Clostridium tyrobutyricum]